MSQENAHARRSFWFIYTERSYRDWIRRHIIFHGMKDRAELFIRGEKNKKKALSFRSVLHKTINNNWSRWADSNRWLTHYECVALPTELHRPPWYHHDTDLLTVSWNFIYPPAFQLLYSLYNFLTFHFESAALPNWAISAFCSFPALGTLTPHCLW